MSNEQPDKRESMTPAEMAHFMAGLFAKCHELEFNGQTLDKMLDVEGYLRDQAALACAPSHVVQNWRYIPANQPPKDTPIELLCADGSVARVDYYDGYGRFHDNRLSNAGGIFWRPVSVPSTTAFNANEWWTDRGFGNLATPQRIQALASAASATRRTHDVLLAITHGYVEWEATGDFDKLVKAINEAEVHRQEIAPPQNNSPDGGKQT